MTIDGAVLIGDGPDSLEGTRVTTPAGLELFREGVVVSDPDVAAARAKITSDPPALSAYGLVVRVAGEVSNVGLSQLQFSAVRNYATELLSADFLQGQYRVQPATLNALSVYGRVFADNPALAVVGTGAATSALRVQLSDDTLQALETIQVGNFPAVQPVSDNGGSLTVDGSVSVSNFPATQPVSGTVAVQQATAANLNATVTGTVQANNLVGGTAVSNANPIPISDAGGSVTVDGSVNVGNFPATQAVSGTVSVTQATAANLNATVTGSVSVSNFPATQAVSGTVTANAGTGTFAISAVSLPLPTGAASASNQTTTNTTLSSLDNKTPDESGAWGYNAGTNGSLAVAANKRIIAITATASPLTAASMTINAGQTITIPAGTSITITPRANLTAPTLVFTSTASYFVEFVE